jgi:hypothetical protein
LPRYEGMEPISQTRLVTALDCELSKEPLDTSHVGYQEPEPMETRPVTKYTPKPKQDNQKPGYKYLKKDDTTSEDNKKSDRK